MAHARPFWTSTLEDLFNDIRNISTQGVLTLAITFWVFESPGGLPSPIFGSVSAPHVCLKVGLWHPASLKERWCPHHVLCFFCFFTNLLWNSSMASWACSISNSFTQDAFIGWYPFHLTKYSRSRPFSCLDLNVASTSNSYSLWMRSNGSLELRSRLGLEASRETNFKSETWNVGWTLRFFGNSNL
jgi:hypothetical protein